MCMLLVYHYRLTVVDQELLINIDHRVSYWPRSWVQTNVYNSAIPEDWWISFSSSNLGLLWIMYRPEYSEIIYRE